MPSRPLLLTVLGIVLFSSILQADLITANHDRARGDYAAAAAEYKRLAQAGDPVAQVNLGYMYYTGEGVAQDYIQAIDWYTQAATQGNADGQYNLAVAYAFGEGVEQDYNTATKWYRAAAEQGHAVAQYSLGLSYSYGEGLNQDPAEAVNWFIRSAEQGYIRAQVLLGSKYHTADGVPLNYEEAVKWYRLAADQGDAMAQYNLAGMYRTGNGVARDNTEALNWYTKSAAQGYTAATVDLATLEGAAAREDVVAAAPVAGPEVSISAPEEETLGQPESIAEPEPVLDLAQDEPVTSSMPEETTDVKAEPVIAEQPQEYPTDQGDAGPTPPMDKIDTSKAEYATTEQLVANQLRAVESVETEVPLSVDQAETIASVSEQQDSVPMQATPEGPVSPLQSQAMPIEGESTEHLVQIQLAALSKGETEPEADSGLMSIDTIDLALPSDTVTRELLTSVPPSTTRTSSGSMDAAVLNVPELPTEPERQPAEERTGGFFSRIFGTTVQPDKTGIDDDHDTAALPVEVETAISPEMITDSDLLPETRSVPPASLYENGLTELNNKNFGTAVNQFKSAAARGYPLAQYQLGSLYYQGLGIKQDYEQASLWYRRAAEQGNLDAQYGLGNMYLMGEGIGQDDVQAKYWYEQAANQGHAAARHNLSNLTRLETTPRKSDMDNTVSTNEINADAQAPQAEQETDVIEARDRESTPGGVARPVITGSTSETDTSMAVVNYERGLAYSFGDGVSKDTQAAFSLYEKAAHSGYAPAQYKLGVAYAYGDGTTIDRTRSAFWYQKAAIQGHTIAQRNLGLLYQSGEGIGQNKALALAWFSLLADSGNLMDVRRYETFNKEASAKEIEQSVLLKQDLINEMQDIDN